MCIFPDNKPAVVKRSVVPDSNQAATAAREERIRRQGSQGLGAAILSRGASAATPAGTKAVLGI